MDARDWAPGSSLGRLWAARARSSGRLGSTTPSSREQACRCPTSAWPKLSDTGGVQPGRQCRHRDRLAPSALECSPRRMPRRALQQSVFRLTQCSTIKRGLAAYRLPRTCALPARCTGVGRGSEILVPWPKEVKQARSSFREAAQPAPPGRWRDQSSPLRGKLLVLMRSGSDPPRRPVSMESIALISVAVRFGLKTSKVSAMRRGRTDFGIAPPMIGAAMPGNRSPPRGAGRCAARKQSTRGYASNGPCAPVPTSPNQVRSGA